MHYASYSLCLLLIAVSIPTYNGNESVKKVSGEEDDYNIDILSSISLFLGLHSSSYHRVPISPSPAPTPNSYVTRIPSLHRKSHYSSERRSGDDRGKSPRNVVVIVAVVVLVVGVAVLVVCKWRRRRRSRRSSGRSKVSYDPDPGPESFYLDSLATVLEVEPAHKSESKNASSDESLCVVKCSSASSICSAKSESVLVMECESDDDGSFHSVVYCRSSGELLSGRCSPLSSSTSAEFKPIQFPPLVTERPHFLTPSKFEGEKLPLPPCGPPTPPPPPPLPVCGPSTNRPPPPPPPLPPCGPSTNRLPPPPPPPFLPKQSAAVGKDGAPLPKLKPLHWDKVRATPDRSMVWDKIRSSSFELDEQMIESLFGYNIHSNAKSEDAKNKSSSPRHVLDHKRLQNITILMKAVNANAEQVCEALKQGRGLSAQQLEALVKMAPTKEEEEKLANFSGDIGDLGSAEIFVKEILGIEFAFSRIRVMLFRETFDDEVVHLKKSFAMLEEACEELRSSRLFFRLLEAVLKTGNRMNVGTIRGGARAFKLDTLLKLADVKGTDGKTTLLHFVVQEIIRSEGEEDVMGLDIVSGLSTELNNVKKTASVDLDVLASSVTNLAEGMQQLERLVEVDIPIDETSGSFANSMRLFAIRAEKTIKKLKDDEHRVLVRVREITEYYHGDVSKDEANPLRIFVVVRDFLGMLDRVCKEIGSSKNYQCLNLGVATFR